MPVYEYECRRCGHRFEKIEQFDASARKKCPVCGCKAERVFSSGVGFIFKGTGFYATDYARKDGRGEAKESEKGEGGSRDKE